MSSSEESKDGGESKLIDLMNSSSEDGEGNTPDARSSKNGYDHLLSQSSSSEESNLSVTDWAIKRNNNVESAMDFW